MEFHFAHRMDQFQAGIFNVLDDKKKRWRRQAGGFITSPSARRISSRRPTSWLP